MPAANTQPSPQQKGEVRIRSNVCTASNAWHLVPGDVIRAYGLPQQNLTPQQHEEMTYYDRCCLCHRTIFEIREDGCDRLNCRDQGILSTAEARQQRQQRDAQHLKPSF